MLENIKSANRKAILARSLRYIFLGLVLTIPLILFFIIYKPLSSFNHDDIGFGDHARMSLNIVAGPFAELVSKGTYTAYLGMLTGPTVEETEFKYYVAQLEFADINGFVAVQADTAFPFRIDFLEIAMKKGIKTYYYGKFIKSSDINSYFHSALIACGVNPKELSGSSSEYIFLITGGLPFIRILLALTGFILVLFAVVQIIKLKRGVYLSRFSQDTKDSPFSEDDIASDLAVARSFDKKGYLMIGANNTFLEIHGRHPRVIPNKNIDSVKFKKRSLVFKSYSVILYFIKNEEKPIRLYIDSDFYWIDRMIDFYKYYSPVKK